MAWANRNRRTFAVPSAVSTTSVLPPHSAAALKGVSADPGPWYLNSYLAGMNCSFDEWSTFTGSFFNGASAVVTPFDGPAYASARAMMYVQFSNVVPLMVILAVETDDVCLAVNFAAKHNIKITPRSGRHCTAGFSEHDQYMCIDTSALKGVYVDSTNNTALFGAGCNWDEINRELERRGYHTTGGGCPSVGVAGYSLGGGYGFTARKFGVATDNILEVTLVAANGQVVVANQTQNTEIYWAHRGGMGGNFGVVTTYKFQIYPLGLVWGCMYEWSIDIAAQVLQTYMANFTNSANSDPNVGIQAVLCHTQDPNTGALTPVVGIACIYTGPTDQARKALAPLLSIPNPVYHEEYTDMPYSTLNYNILNPIEGIIPITISSEYKMSRYISRQLSVADIQHIVDWFKTAPPGAGQYNICAFESYGAKINSVGVQDTAFVHRNMVCDFFGDSFYQTGTSTGYQQAKDWLYNFIIKDPYGLFSTESYQNYPNLDYPNWQTSYFGDPSNNCFTRLQRVKTALDPTDMFTYVQGVPPFTAVEARKHTALVVHYEKTLPTPPSKGKKEIAHNDVHNGKDVHKDVHVQYAPDAAALHATTSTRTATGH